MSVTGWPSTGAPSSAGNGLDLRKTRGTVSAPFVAGLILKRHSIQMGTLSIIDGSDGLLPDGGDAVPTHEEVSPAADGELIRSGARMTPCYTTSWDLTLRAWTAAFSLHARPGPWQRSSGSSIRTKLPLAERRRRAEAARRALARLSHLTRRSRQQPTDEPTQRLRTGPAHRETSQSRNIPIDSCVNAAYVALVAQPDREGKQDG